MKTPERTLEWTVDGFNHRAQGLRRVYWVYGEPLGLNRFTPSIQRGAVTFRCNVAFDGLDDAKHFCQSDHESIFDIQSDAREGVVPFDMPKLMPTTAQLVLDFAKALADKLAAAEVKYGYGDSWATPDAEDWPHPKCFTDLVKHLQKGDPRDVAIYCAFLWYHGLSTSKCIEMAGMVPAAELRPTLDMLRASVQWNHVKKEITRLETLLGEK